MIDFDALEAANAPLNAFSDFDPTAAFGEGPLAGLAIGVKANIAVAGMPWHAGLAAFETRLAERDADTVALLRQAGAAIVGVLNMEEAALGAKTDNPHFGPVHNPHRIGFSPGGSSGGSGAAVAAGLVDAALGTDTMGSIRIPAAHCGVYGFKPATASVSQEGLEPADLTLDAIGPLARDLDTLERVARVISGFGDDPLEDPGATLVEHGVAVHPEVASAFDAALAALGEAPVKVALSHPQSRIRFAGFIGVAREMAAHLSGIATSERLAKLLAYGPRRSLADWAEDRDVLARTRDEVRSVVEEHGFLILPTVPNPPFPHSEPEPAAQADFTCLANIAGLPALSFPAGWTADGLPIGVQIVAPAGAETGLFALTRHLDDTLRAYRPPSQGV
ncbi:amidase [Erythrobacter sp. WG]|uniref:amidase n=1 Tax=Erythrobacter sp. WG TaxID=2985510 RepID=UPI0022701A42|nr:amidase [Erythrobacter sp. WG]MCX9147977.1 amidase [Erythrobacter sp. WG]